MFVKICGTTSEDDALLSVAMGADALGFIFAPSTRQIAPQVAADIVKRLPSEIIPVGVFRDELPQRVVEICQYAGLRAAQLHGRETGEQTRWVRRQLGMAIKAFPAGSADVVAARDHGADAILLDSPHPGSGQVFDWAFAQEVPVGQNLIVAGGLTTDNVAGAVARTGAWGVDAATGVESSPGHKDPVKLRAFIAAARAAAPRRYRPDGAAPYDWQEED